MAEVEAETEEAQVTSEPTHSEGGDPARIAHIEAWVGRIKDTKQHFDKDFKRMRKCMQLARHGAENEWLAADKYVVPIINRHIKQAVAQLYAKHPRTTAERRRKMRYSLWDGSMETARAAYEAYMAGDPTQLPLLQEIQTAREEMLLHDRMGQTLEIVDDYFMNEQARNYKAQLKKMVRRVKITGVGFVKLGFQRELGIAPPNPDKEAAIADARSQIERIEEITAKGEAGELQPDSPEIEELRRSLASLEQEETIIVREGPVLSFPRSTQVIIDKQCHHLRTLAGADFVAYEYDMTPDRVRGTYKVDIGKSYTGYTKSGEKTDEKGGRGKARVWQVWDKINQQCFTICDGYTDYLKAPEAPDVRLDRFFDLFPLVFNEDEEDDCDENSSIYPMSDVWLARHPQAEYNRSRQGLREHRIASRPYYVTAQGLLEEQDRQKLGAHAAHEVLELNLPASENIDINRVIQRGPATPIDPNQYEVESLFQDVLRSVGTQEANIGGTAGATATESSIAESSRMSSLEDNIDDLDEFLSELSKAKGQLYLLNLSKETVMEIAGPGAAWPDLPPTREEVARDLILDIKAGSSGRPNKAAKLADLERAMPFVVQLPSVNPTPFVDNYMRLLDIDTEEAVVDGMPSITALNAMLSSAATAPSTGDPATDPNAQGGQGAQNAPQPDDVGGQAQGEFPI